jgi:hypothetical protein
VGDLEERRDEAWLAERVRLLWEHHFADVPVGYPITVGFGSRARNRFGSIAARNKQAVIRVNRLYADPDVPTYVVDETLAHELAHYAHGFGSGLPQLHTHAHRGGVVDRELEKRGLGELNAKAEAWRKANWAAFYAARCPDLTARRANRQEAVCERWERFLRRSGNRSEADLSAMLATLSRTFRLAPSPPMRVEWLRANTRQTALSYWFAKESLTRVHGLLADPRVPQSVIELELAYWLLRRNLGGSWGRIEAALRQAGREQTTREALRWRQRAWTAFRRRNHPLI